MPRPPHNVRNLMEDKPMNDGSPLAEWILEQTTDAVVYSDTEGRIELDVPVKGSLDDPKFNVWSVVWQVLENLLVKAATAPFARSPALAIASCAHRPCAR